MKYLKIAILKCISVPEPGFEPGSGAVCKAHLRVKPLSF